MLLESNKKHPKHNNLIRIKIRKMKKLSFQKQVIRMTSGALSRKNCEHTT